MKLFCEFTCPYCGAQKSEAVDFHRSGNVLLGPKLLIKCDHPLGDDGDNKWCGCGGYFVASPQIMLRECHGIASLEGERERRAAVEASILAGPVTEDVEFFIGRLKERVSLGGQALTERGNHIAPRAAESPDEFSED